MGTTLTEQPAAMQSVLNRVADGLTAQGQRLAVAESCTGGLIAAACTELAGSSAWFDGGIVCYANEVKQNQLGVSRAVLERAGAVSAEVVLAMVDGLLESFSSDWAIAVSGVAGPGGGSPEKPVGTVWVAWAGRHQACGSASVFSFGGDRQSVRQQAVIAALEGLADLVESAAG